MEEPRIASATVCSSDEEGNAMSSAGDHDCSVRSVCGPHPRLIAIGIAVVLSIWAVAILGAHVYKKVGGCKKFTFLLFTV
jgi:hypothetical protein